MQDSRAPVPYTHMKKHLNVFFICSVLMAGALTQLGCSEPKGMNRIESIVLRDGDTAATLELPAAYMAKKVTSGFAQFDCQYPNMQPTVNKVEVSDMTVNILLGHSLKSHAEMTIEQAHSDRFDPNRPGAVYRNGTKGEYQVFLSGNPVSDPKGFSTYYLFKAKDNQWVQVEWSDWSEIYMVDRQMNPDVSVRYWFRKSKGTDFIHVDEIVTKFIKAHLKLQH